MAEVGYRCPGCEALLTLAEARGAEFRCDVCDHSLKRVARDDPDSELGAPTLKGAGDAISKLFDADTRKVPDLESEEPSDDRDGLLVPPQARSGARSVPARRAGWLTLLALALPLLIVAVLTWRLDRRVDRLASAVETLNARQPEMDSRDIQLTDDLGAQGRRLAGLEAAAAGGPQRTRFLAQMQSMFPDVVERFSTALVHITDRSWVWSGGKRYPRVRTGSGFLIKPRGLVLTNFHVVGGVSKVKCRLFNSEEVDAVVHGSDPASDIALLRMDLEGVRGADKIVPAELGSSSGLRSGQLVIALGSPKSLARTITLGIVSNTQRYLDVLPLTSPWVSTGWFCTWIQVDTPINPGNSGGPLIDLDGKVVGVVTRKLSSADNIGFALPIDYVKPLIEQIKRRREVSRTTIGAFIAAYRPLNADVGGGVKVIDVVPGSEAERRGVRAGDLLLEYNGAKLSARFANELPAARLQLASAPVGRPTPLVRLRAGTRTTLRVTPRLRAASDDRTLHFKHWGFYAQEVTADLALRHKLSARSGLWVCGLEHERGLFKRHGIERGDVVLKLAGKPLQGLEPFYQLARQLMTKRATPISITIQRGAQPPRQLQLQLHYPK